MSEKKRNRGGGKAIKGVTQIKTENDIKTPPWLADVIFSYLKPHYSGTQNPLILDACSGKDFVLGYAIKKKIKNCYLKCFDILINNCKIQDFNFAEKFDIIVCNPPWTPVTEAFEIYLKLKSILTENGVLIFIINNSFCYQGISRAYCLDYQKYYFLHRSAFADSGKKLLDCGVLVFHNNGFVPVVAANLKPFIWKKRELDRDNSVKKIRKNTVLENESN